jgi:hypothetical protein
MEISLYKKEFFLSTLGRREMSPLVPNNGTKWDWSTSRSGRFTPWKEPWYPLNRETGWVPEHI